MSLSTGCCAYNPPRPLRIPPAPRELTNDECSSRDYLGAMTWRGSMTWSVVMEGDGTVTLPPDLITALGWTPETRLRWQDEESGVSLRPINEGENAGAS